MSTTIAYLRMSSRKYLCRNYQFYCASRDLFAVSFLMLILLFSIDRNIFSVSKVSKVSRIVLRGCSLNVLVLVQGHDS